MEIKKDIATKLLDLSKDRFKAKDIKGALQLAQRAQVFFPGLKYIKETIAAYQVHLEASKSEPTDWHAVMQIERSANFSTIKRQFKKMCLLTHPDKNMGCSAADGAFKLIMKAWSFLSATKRSGSKEKKPKESKPEEKTTPNWEYTFSLISCQKCKPLFHYWRHRRLDKKQAYHECIKCGKWGMINGRLAKPVVPLTCEGCGDNLCWGLCCPFGFDCSNCGCYYVAGIDPIWMPSSQDKWNYGSSVNPETISCPFCGAWNDYVTEEGNKCNVRCMQCGLRSIIQLAKDK